MPVDCLIVKYMLGFSETDFPQNIANHLIGSCSNFRGLPMQLLESERAMLVEVPKVDLLELAMRNCDSFVLWQDSFLFSEDRANPVTYYS